MTLIDDLAKIERELWKNDADLYGYHLDDSALLLFPETGVITRAFALDAIRQEQAEGRQWAEVNFSTLRVQPINDDATVLIYDADARWNDDEAPVSVSASTVYARKGGRWRVIFHQQTNR